MKRAAPVRGRSRALQAQLRWERCESHCTHKGGSAGLSGVRAKEGKWFRLLVRAGPPGVKPDGAVA